MRLGVLAYSTPTGLGYQTRALVEHLNPVKVLIADLSTFNEIPTDHSWCPQARITEWPTDQDCLWLTSGVDAIFVAETPLNYNLFSFAEQRGVKVIQQYNAEFLDYYRNPDWPTPTVLAAPTTWKIDEVKQLDVAPVEILPVPIQNIDVRDITKLETIVHVIGRPSVFDRNGTLAFLQMAERLPQYQYKIFLQTPTDQRAVQYFEPVKNELLKTDFEIVADVEDNRQMFDVGDLLVLPRRYGGLCLPMLEALGRGIPTVMTDISPNNDILPQEWLCKTEYRETYHGHTSWDIYEPDIDSLVSTVENLDIKKANRQAIDFANRNSWETLKQNYFDMLTR